MTKSKVCTYCKEELPLSYFTPHKRYKLGVLSRCKKCVSETRKSRSGCGKTLTYQKEYYYKNKDKILSNPSNKQRVKEWVSANRERHNETNRIWLKNNKGYGRFKAANRRAAKAQATPNWLSEDDKRALRQIYETCQTMEAKFGLKYHVDHIVPLKGDNICGLHVPWNLQILEASLNISKSNKF
jgi:hypothetical protein